MAALPRLTRAPAAAVLAAAGLSVSACAGDEPAPADVPTASPSAAGTSSPAGSPSDPTFSASPSRPGRPGAGVVVATSGSEFGTMLFDGRGQAIYLFDKETTSEPACYGACAEAWPPVLAGGSPRARGEVREGLLDTVRRRDGRLQVTYAGHPLYYYAHEGPGQVLCHDIVEYGGTWLVVTPEGRAAPA